MEYIAVYTVVGLAIILSWLWVTYALGRYFGRQEQFLIDLKREHEEHRVEVLRRQEEMEEDWAAYYAEEASQVPPEPDAPKPSEPENVRRLERRVYARGG